MKIDRNNNILRDNGTVLGAPTKNGNIYRSANKTGRIDAETGKVYNLKGELLGTVDVSRFPVLAQAKPKTESKTEPKKKVKTSKKTEKKTTKKVVKTPVEPEKPAEKKTEKKTEKKEQIAPGMDSKYILSGGYAKDNFPQFQTGERKSLAEVNQKYGWNYKTWTDLAKHEDPDDAFLVKYDNVFEWYTYLKFHPDRHFDEKHEKLFREHLILRRLRLVPYNGKIEEVDNDKNGIHIKFSNRGMKKVKDKEKKSKKSE